MSRQPGGVVRSLGLRSRPQDAIALVNEHVADPDVTGIMVAAVNSKGDVVAIRSAGVVLRSNAAFVAAFLIRDCVDGDD